MANPEHVEIVRQGAEAIRAWRDRNPYTRLDLSEADLTRTDLDRADLQSADFNTARVGEALLRNANLSGVDFTLADLTGSNLTQACLKGAMLRGANLGFCNLTGADLRGARLALANLTIANLEQADLREAGLTLTNLASARLAGADLSGTVCGGTIFADVDLSEVTGLGTVTHGLPSTIGVETLFRSKGKVPDVFLRGCGVPEVLIEYIRSLPPEAFDFYTCFIAFAEPDDAFAERLYRSLRGKRVQCWRWKEDARWGRTLIREVDQAIRRYDKLVVILSEHSLKSEPVIREIERALQREQREGKDVLFPIRLDEAIFSWKHELHADVLRKYIGDFRNWEHPESYRKALERLIRDLRGAR